MRLWHLILFLVHSGPIYVPEEFMLLYFLSTPRSSSDPSLRIPVEETCQEGLGRFGQTAGQFESSILNIIEQLHFVVTEVRRVSYQHLIKKHTK